MRLLLRLKRGLLSAPWRMTWDLAENTFTQTKGQSTSGDLKEQLFWPDTQGHPLTPTTLVPQVMTAGIDGHRRYRMQRHDAMLMTLQAVEEMLS